MVFALGSSVGDDVKWKSAIDRALGTWESVVEWADYISFLSRVQKAVKNKFHCEGADLPLAPQISEMLARCLEPTLPAGVHQTCLDVYDSIFTIIGPEILAKTTNIWLPGILPVPSWAAFNVKPLIIQLFSKHIIPAVTANPQELPELYRPTLMSFLQSIEDETSDCYAEICELLDNLAYQSEQSCDMLFWRCFDLCLITSPGCRLGGLTYFQRTQTKATKDDFFIRAVCSGLEDQNVLVQRGFLDVLAKHLPLNSAELQNNQEIFEKLILSACRTILRKDMSLNRRLRLWLMGPEPEKSESESSAGHTSRLDYLKKYASTTLIRVLCNELNENLSRTCIIAQGLMDRWEVGVTIAPALLTPILHLCYCKKQVEASVASFFDNIESCIVWNTALQLIERSPETVLFMTQSLNIKDEEMLAFYIPLTIVYILADETLTAVNSSIVEQLIELLPHQELPELPSKQWAKAELRDRIASTLKEMVEADLQSDEARQHEVIPKKELSWYMLQYAGDVMLRSGTASMLNSVLRLFPDAPGLEVEIPQCDKLIQNLNPTSQGGVELFIHIVGRMSESEIQSYVTKFCQALAESLISNSSRQLQYVKELWLINESTNGNCVTSAISVIMADTKISPFNRAKFFAGIWSLSTDQTNTASVLIKPLLLFMDLELEDKSVYQVYLQSSVVRTGSASRMVKLLVDKLDSELRNDPLIFNYVLENLLSALKNPDILTAYISKYAILVCTLLLEWFDQAILPDIAYSNALELAELTILDNRVKDGKVWLRRFVDALSQNYITGKAGQAVQNSRLCFEKGNSAQAKPDPSENVGCATVPVALVKFVTAAVSSLDSTTEVRLFAQVCVERLQSEVDYEVFNQLLLALLETDPEVEVNLLKKAIEKIQDLDHYYTSSGHEDAGDQRGILHLLSSVEAIMSTGIQVVRQGTSKSNSSGGITSALASFQVETPEDRSRADNLQIEIIECLDASVKVCCKKWLSLYQTRAPGGSASIKGGLHATGRLKTRIRKLMYMCYAAYPTETLRLVHDEIGDVKLAVRMTHMFEGSRIGPTLDYLFGMVSNSHDDMFQFATSYVDSLESDVVGDVWPILHQFLITSTSNVSIHSLGFAGAFGGGSNSKNGNAEAKSSGKNNRSSILEFLTKSIIPRFSQLKLKNHKKIVREFGDVYAKLLIAETSDMTLTSQAIQLMPLVISEPDRQAPLLARVLSTLIKSPQDLAKSAELLNAVTKTFNIAGMSPTKVWTHHISDLIFETRLEDSIIPLRLNESQEFKAVIRTWVQCDKEKVWEFSAKLSTYGSSTGVLFGWSGTQELSNSNLRRLAYILVCTPNTILGLDWSKLINQLAGMWSQNAASVCVLLRASVLCQPSSAVMTFIAYRLQTVFSSALSKTEPVKGSEADLLLEACKLVDLAFVINAEPFQQFGWLFLSDNGDTLGDYHRNRKSSDIESDSEEKSGHSIQAGGVLEKLKDSNAISKQSVVEQILAPAPTFKSLRRPLLPLRATLDDVPTFLNQISIANHEEIYAMTAPDREFCEKWLLSDLFLD